MVCGEKMDIKNIMLPFLFFKEEKKEKLEIKEPEVEVKEPEIIEPKIEKKVEVHVDVDSHKNESEEEVKTIETNPIPAKDIVSFPLYDIEPSDNKEDNPERPPKAWWDSTYATIRRQYPGFKPERHKKIVGGIWHEYPEATKRAIWSRHEGQKIRRDREKDQRSK